MTFTYSKKVLLISILITALVLTAVIIIGNLSYQQIISTNNKIEQVKQSAEERARVLALRDSVDDSVRERLQLNSFFVGSEDVETANLIDNLELLAKKNNLSYVVKTVTYDNKLNETNYNNLGFLKIKMHVTGSWSNVIKFVRLIENYPKTTSVSNLVLDKTGSNWLADIDFIIAKLK